MPDYKEMYLRLSRATEKAVQVLIAAQQECEELYLASPEGEFKVFSAEVKADEGKAPSG